MKIKCKKVIKDFESAFCKGKEYESTEVDKGFCVVTGDRLKKDGTHWVGVLSIGSIVVLGVARFDIISEEYRKDV